MSKPLEGIRVIELGAYVSATTTGRILADMGAEVIKIERPEGDGWRNTGRGTCYGHFCDEENPVYELYNTGKKHIVLNIKTESGMAALHELLASADIFLTNNRPKALKKNGLDWETLRALYPRLIYAIVLGYGDKGPDATTPAFDTTAYWARTGMALDFSFCDETGKCLPINTPWSVGDTPTGMFLVSEINAALYARERTGKGDYVVSSLYHIGMFQAGSMYVRSRDYGQKFPMQLHERGIASMYPCHDGSWLLVQLIDAQALYPKLYPLLGKPEWCDDPRFNSIEGRTANAKYVYDEIGKVLYTKTADEWEELSKKVDLQLVRMRHFNDIPKDEQAWANGYLEMVHYPNGAIEPIVTSPVEMESVGTLHSLPCSPVGGDTAEVLKTVLGYSDEKIAAMVAEKAINAPGETPAAPRAETT